MGLGFSEKIRDVSSPDKVSGDEDYIKDSCNIIKELHSKSTE